VEQAGMKEAEKIFEQRIVPIFKSSDPSSCTQCHLGGVDLKNYIKPTSSDTFTSLRDQGLIDLDHPDQSKILTLIKMGEKDSPEAALIHEKARNAEFEAFAHWIKTSVKVPELRNAPKLKTDVLAGPKSPIEVIRYSRKDRILASFENSIWAMRFRCMGCHEEGSDQNRKLVEEHGEQVAWMKKGGVVATLAYLRDSELINMDDSSKSLLLLKPLGEVKHGGGKKMLVGDQGYKAYRSFLEDYVRVVQEKYPDKKSLPIADSQLQFGSSSWLRLTNTPASWAGHLVEIDIYAWDESSSDWEKTPIATSDRGMSETGSIWQHTITLLADKGTKRSADWSNSKPKLLPGAFLLKVYVDKTDRLLHDWKSGLGESDFVGDIKIMADWPEGPGKFTIADVAGFTE
jgi:hypothetical protein